MAAGREIQRTTRGLLLGPFTIRKYLPHWCNDPPYFLLSEPPVTMVAKHLGCVSFQPIRAYR